MIYVVGIFIIWFIGFVIAFFMKPMGEGGENSNLDNFKAALAWPITLVIMRL